MISLHSFPQRPAQRHAAANIGGLVHPDRQPMRQMGIGQFRRDGPCIQLETLLRAKAHQADTIAYEYVAFKYRWPAQTKQRS